MWRVFNFRAFLLTAICAIVTILSICLLPNISGIIVTVLILLSLSGGFFFAYKRDTIKSIAFFLSTIVVIVLSVNLFCTFNAWKEEIVLGEEYEIKGKIEIVFNDGDTLPYYYLGDVTANGKDIDGRISVTIVKDNGVNLSFLESGDFISFTTNDIGFNELISDIPKGYIYRDNVKYFTTVSENSITFIEDRSNLLDALRTSISNALNESMGEYGTLAVSMITGNKGMLSDDTVNMYSAVGIGHILAVSGLHIGFIIAVLNWILDKTKTNEIIHLIICLSVLLLYCALSFFSASAIRACIMCIVGLIASIFGERKDMLNSLSFAFTLILCVKPIYLFDIGFLMSISAVFGIILFKDAINKLFNRFLPKFIASALAISISAQIGITPITIIAFNTFNTYSILSNLIVIPIVSLSFTVIMFALILTLILPFMSFLLSISGILLALVDTIANLIAFIPFAKIIIFAPTLFYFSYVAFFLISGFFMLPKFKAMVSITLIVGIVALLFIFNIPIYPEFNINMTAEYKSVTSVVRIDDGVVIVGDCKNGSKINALLSKIKERNIKAVLVHSLDEETVSGIVKINEKFGVDKVYCPSICSFSALQSLVKEEIDFVAIENDCSVMGFEPVIIDNNYFGYGYGMGDIRILFTGYGQNTSKIPISVINEYAIIRSYVYGGNYSKRIYLTNYKNSYLEDGADNEVCLDKNYLAFMLKSGEIINL